MKKFLLLVVILFAMIQKKSSAQFLFGPQIGFSYATLTGTDDLTLSPKPEWHAGLLFDLGLGKHFSLQPSLLYSKRGYKYDYETYSTTVLADTSYVTYTTADVDAALGYLDIPVLLNIYLGDHKGFTISAGPQLSVLLTDQSTATTATTVSVNGGTPQTTKPDTKTKFKFNPADISLVAGVGYKLDKLLLVYLRASTGFAKVQEDNTILKDGNEGKNFTFEAGLALTFGSE
jgi:opacity protein-like surface antigen